MKTVKKIVKMMMSVICVLPFGFLNGCATDQW